MNKYLILTKTLFINSFKPINNKSFAKNIIFVIILFTTMSPLAFSIGKLISFLYGILAPVHQEGIILGLGFSIISAAIFFFGIFYILSIFYFAKDVENFIYLPLTPIQIICAKFSITLIFEYITELIFYIPLILVYGIKSNGNAIFWLYSIILFIMIPLIPLMFASIIDMIVMRFANNGINRDKFRMFAGLFALFLAFGLNITIQKYNAFKLSKSDISSILNSNNSLLNFISSIFPDVKYASLSIINSNNAIGLLNLLIFTLLNILAALIFAYIGKKIYLRGVIGISQTSTGKTFNQNQINKVSIKQSILKSYVFKELKILIRTPVYFMNCVITNFIWPIFMLLPVLFQPNSGKNFEKAAIYIRNSNINGVIIAIITAIGVFLTASNSIASTSISREGRQIYVNKFIPVSIKIQLFSKVISAALFGLIGTIAMTIALTFLFKLTTALITFSIIASLFGVFLSAFIGIFIDLNFPKLIWEDEQKAVKQNFNVFISMFISIALSFVIIYPVYKFHLNLLNSFLGIAIILGAANLAAYKLLATKGVKIFKNIEI